MMNDLILRVVAKLLIPFILLFALYVQFHGDFGPGGGFQAGVILAAAVIFYALIYGLADARKAVEVELGSRGRVLIRASGTEPVLRIMVEARDAAEARACADRMAAALA
mgnify:CR=1 FL=1